MKQWIDKLFLLAGFALLLVHNILVHHPDEHAPGLCVEQHNNAVLDHVNVDDAFYTDLSADHKLPAIVALLSVIPELRLVLFPEKENGVVVFSAATARPPDRTVGINILRGPPAQVNTAV